MQTSELVIEVKARNGRKARFEAEIPVPFKSVGKSAPPAS
jgi:hypothetical protein